MQRRQFIQATAGLIGTIPGMSVFGKTHSQLRIGIIGTGLRGQVHLEELLKRGDVDVAAICDIEPFMLDAALKRIFDAGKPKPQVFTGNPHAWREMFARAKLDAVIIATPWVWHASQAIAAMHARIAVGCEVVAGITLDEH